MGIIQELSPLFELFCSLIEAGAIIAAAMIGVRELNSIAQKRLDNYRDKSGSVSELLIKAKSDITIVVAYGDKLMTEFAPIIEWCLSRGVKVRYLMLTVAAAEKMNRDFLGNMSVNTAEQVKMVKDLLEKMEGKENLEVREWSGMLPVSYIGIDIGRRGPGSVIHMMPYLYNTGTDNSPISYLTYDASDAQFKVTANSIENMWKDAKPAQHCA